MPLSGQEKDELEEPGPFTPEELLFSIEYGFDFILDGTPYQPALKDMRRGYEIYLSRGGKALHESLPEAAPSATEAGSGTRA